jgi:putative ABC transport system permease protein
MLFKILKKDLQNKKVISIVLFIFIMLSALTLSSSSVIIVQLMSSIDHLFANAAVPHFVQMHKGDINQAEIDAFTASQTTVTGQQTVKMISIDGAELYIGDPDLSESSSVLDVSFVKQNEAFDYLLSLDNEILHLEKGGIGVPIFYIAKNNLKIGDKVYLRNEGFSAEYTITNFIRDGQMNPSLISSKRFLVSDDDYQYLEGQINETEYLIEFQLADLENLPGFATSYDLAGLPNKGPAVDVGTFRMLNLITDGIVSVVIVLVSILLTAIAIISLRFTILSSMEDDVKEIGVMKAIGYAHQDIRNIYLIKYVSIAVVGCLAGYIGSLLLSDRFLANVQLYMGVSEKSPLLYFIPLAASLLILTVVTASCMMVVSKLKKITAVSALRNGTTAPEKTRKSHFSLHRSGLMNINLFLGIKDITSRMKTWWLLMGVFIISAFVMILPVNLFNTVNDASFSTYMGIEESDIRIDLQQSDHLEQRYYEIITTLNNDEAVADFSTLATCKFKIRNNEGEWNNINVTTGDLSRFPLTYLEGASPAAENEIALSYLNANEMQAGIGDEITLLANGQEHSMVVSGIYQDVTNGGRTAKAMLPPDTDTLLWYVVNINIKPGYEISEKVNEYSAVFSQARVTDLNIYVLQTFSDTLKQLKTIRNITILVSAMIACLITSMFLKMLIVKDRAQIAIMKNIGFASKDIVAQYIIKTLIILGIGITLGAALCNSLGEVFISAIGATQGAPKISFEIHPLEAYLLYPIILMIATSITTVINCQPIQENSNTTDMFE